MKYQLYLIFENSVLSGGDFKIIAVREGHNIEDYLSKYDNILDPNRGTIEISGDMKDLEFYIVVNEDYDLSFKEKMEYGYEDEI